MSNTIIAISPQGVETKMNKLIAQRHKELMLQAGEKGWTYTTQEELSAIQSDKANLNVQLLNKDVEILNLRKRIAELEAMIVAQDEKDTHSESVEAPMNAKVVIGFINSAQSKEEVERIIANESRQSVLKSAKKRITELA